MDSSDFYASKAQKVLVVTSSIALVGVTLGFFCLWLLGKAPIFVSITFLLLAIALAARAIVLFRAPVVRIENDVVIVAGWFGTRRSFDPRSPIDIFANGTGAIIKQGGLAVGLSRYALGKAHFDEVLRALTPHEIDKRGLDVQSKETRQGNQH